MPDFYETPKALGEYLLFHYGEAVQILPHQFGPHSALNYPLRCVTECLDTSKLPENARALDLGCAVGRSTFELARHCTEVIGIDFSHNFIESAEDLREHGWHAYTHTIEGALMADAVAKIDKEIDRSRVSFEQGDAMNLRKDLGAFDVILMANLIDRLADPKKCLNQLPSLMNSGGHLIITSPCTWLEQYTPKANWIGGFEKDGEPFSTLDGLKEILSPEFDLFDTRDLPFLIREHARKFQWSVAQASIWMRK
jgi:putative 4-mercaptohistidine N1-methyltranferase